MSLTGPSSPRRPSLSLRFASSMLMGLTGLLSKGFLYGFNNVEVIGLQGFLDILDSRKDIETRQRGLVTVSNHISIIDDPLMWGVLPLRYAIDSANLRWALAADDICFKNRALARFFNLGQTLSMHRFRHSPFGGLFQPTMADAIRLLSSAEHRTPPLPIHHQRSPSSSDSLLKTSAEEGRETHLAPSQDPSSSSSSYRPWGSHAWIHVFPEGCVHQQPARGLRYFKWGVARLVLESGPSPPDVVPIFVDGTDRIMAEDRGFPRFVPRVGKTVSVVFGKALDTEAAFGDLRRKWEALVEEAAASSAGGRRGWMTRRAAEPVDLEHGDEARAIRMEVARRLRDEVLKLRRSLGYPDEDPKLGLAETWAREPGIGYTYRSKVDGSLTSQR